MVALSAAPPAYCGTNSMSMKGDLPGLSNFCCGYMGSYQYSTLRSSCGADSAPSLAAGIAVMGRCANQ
ncbi:hypothetical protein D3C76_1789530 [compost metagenome]